MHVRQLGYNQALEDLDKAFELDPNKSQIFSNRADALSGLGEYEKAVSAWTKALDLSPGKAYYYLKRGLEWENLERYDLAAEDFLLSLRINPEDIWSALYLYFSRLESGISGTDELRKNTQSLDLKTWPGPIIAFCLGKIPETAVIDAARHPNTSIEKGQLCHAFYHLGKHHLINGNREIAAGLFTQCIETMMTRKIEWRKAKIALSKIGEY
jgi:lipoprotein NlpI